MGMEIGQVGGAPGSANRVIEIPGANASAKNDICEAGASTLFGVEVDATANSGQDVAVPLYDDLTPTVGTTVPRVCVPGFAGKKKTYFWPGGITFATSLSVACVQEVGADGGPTAPSGTVNLKILAKNT